MAKQVVGVLNTSTVQVTVSFRKDNRPQIGVSVGMEPMQRFTLP
jgi:hypothetical protein